MNGEHLSHDAPLLNAELLEIRERLDELFAESDRRMARFLMEQLNELA